MNNLECHLMGKIDMKDSKYQLIELINQKADQSEVDRLKISKLDAHTFESYQHTPEDERFGKAGLLSLDSIYSQLEQKANIDHVNTALTEIHEELDNKAEHSALDSNLKNFENVTEALCAENWVGRWYWKTGLLKNDNAIPWEEQNINTCPENYLWEENKTSILTVAPGLYELKCGLYSNKYRPYFDVLINGMNCLSCTKYNSAESQDTVCFPINLLESNWLRWKQEQNNG